MNDFRIVLKEYLIYFIYGIAIITIFNFFRSCSALKENKKLRKEISILSSEIDSLTILINKNFDKIYTKKELDKRIEIEGLRTSKRILYDWNTVIRTVKRPDDIMNEYDKKIEKLLKELKY